MSDSVLVTVADGIGTLTLNRPAKLNAISRTMVAELNRAMDQAQGDDQVRRRHRVISADKEVGGRCQLFCGWLVSRKIQGRRQENQPVDPGVMLCGKARGHKAAKT